MDRRLHPRFEMALRLGGDDLSGLAGATRADERDGLLTLARIHDLHLGPVDEVGPAVRWQHHPVVAGLKAHLEAELLASLPAPGPEGPDAVAAIRRLGREGLVPAVYDWVADDASEDELVAFLAVEGGPDANFDDLVAICQVGLRGEPKMELARNYWDEMGRGDPARVHTELHRALVAALALPTLPRAQQPSSALRRTALGNVLATNRALQPELVGALGLLELQAGPRCRRVVTAMRRLGLGADAEEFYAEHADADPRHGKDWVAHVIAPLATEPDWASRMVTGARWRSVVNAAFFDDMAATFIPRRRASA
ncbi:iron-containing redox enzyme family protein [Dermatobacter hominis]|uniref:iron-containing redox enzyme family protein n=1 Tax=Dermatobacter hominis TaxID=2884263 RepID=UPI001D12976D|nr:iron-containing redox enzyme family protein [Dermatobacter hominis]UDY36728.1 iron-containing redox enzyme family protein [Dermatobacter hominis]